MREYGQIQSAYWTHPDIQPLSLEAKLIGAYLLTCQHTNGIGCFRMPIGYISIDIGIGIETVSKGFLELFEKGFLIHDERSEYVLIPTFLRWNPISNPNSAKARVKEFDLVPSSISIYSNLINALQKNGKYWGEEFENRLETLSKRYRNPIERVPNDIRDNKTQPRPNPDPTQNKTQPSNSDNLDDAESENEEPEKQTAATIASNCPIQQIVDLYHEALPELPRVRKLTDTRRGYIRQRWREDMPTLDNWKNFFAHVMQSRFLMGKEPGRDGGPPFIADLEWLTKSANFAKIAEGKYHRNLRAVR